MPDAFRQKNKGGICEIYLPISVLVYDFLDLVQVISCEINDSKHASSFSFKNANGFVQKPV